MRYFSSGGFDIDGNKNVGFDSVLLDLESGKMIYDYWQADDDENWYVKLKLEKKGRWPKITYVYDERKGLPAVLYSKNIQIIFRDEFGNVYTGK